MKHDAVVVEPPLAPLGLHPTNAVETCREGALHRRDTNHLTGPIPLSCRVTDLGQRDEPFVGRVPLAVTWKR